MRPPAALASALRPVVGLIWPLFLVWTALVFAVIPFGIGEAQAVDWIPNGASSGSLRETPPSALEAALIQILAKSDCVWLLLAGANAYLCLAHAEGLNTARRWAGILVAGSAVLAGAGALTGCPFGPIAYTAVLGFRIGNVLPFTIPFLWLVIVLGGRRTVLRMFPRATQWQLGFGVALLALLTDLNLEPVAWKIRAWWIWYPTDFSPPAFPPVQNYATWAVAAFAFTLALGENKLTAVQRDAGLRPMVILLLMNAVFLTANAVRWLALPGESS